MSSNAKSLNKKIAAGIGIGVAIIAVIISWQHVQETQAEINQHNVRYLDWQKQVNDFKTEYSQAYAEDVDWYKRNTDYTQELTQYTLSINSGEPRDQDEENKLNNEKAQLETDYDRLIKQDLQVSSHYSELFQQETKLNQEAQQLNQQMDNALDKFKDKANNLGNIFKNGV